jgi:squalene-associated FAD-dependent desaturase
VARTALVAGGGLAGIAAACALADAGWAVTILEKKKRLGGMVASFPDPAGQGELDNGEHIAIEACTELLALLGRLGVSDRLKRQPRLRIPFVSPEGRLAEITESAWSFLAFPFLSLGDRFRVARAVSAIGALRDADIARLDHVAAAEWLDDLGQTARAVARFWDYFVTPALNEPAARASAALAARVLRDGFAGGRHLARFALFRTPLGSVFGEAAEAHLRGKGGEVRALSALKKVRVSSGACAGFEMSDGSFASADVYVLAVPHAELGEVFPESAPPLQHAPIVNAHLWYDRPVTDLEFFAMLDCRVQWVFNKSAIRGDPHGPQHMSCSISAAHDWAHLPSEEIAARCDAEIKRRFTSQAALMRFVVSREPRATFSARPGTTPMRPGPKTRYPNLFLAGAWTDTGYPATMEGAVRSGNAAAKAVIAGR